MCLLEQTSLDCHGDCSKHCLTVMTWVRGDSLIFIFILEINPFGELHTVIVYSFFGRVLPPKNQHPISSWFCQMFPLYFLMWCFHFDFALSMISGTLPVLLCTSKKLVTHFLSFQMSYCQSTRNQVAKHCVFAFNFIFRHTQRCWYKIERIVVHYGKQAEVRWWHGSFVSWTFHQTAAKHDYQMKFIHINSDIIFKSMSCRIFCKYLKPWLNFLHG